MKLRKVKKVFKLLWKYKSLDYKRLDTRARNQRHKERRKKLIETEGRCRFCGSTKNLTIDHIIPRAKGGSKHGLHNLQVLCATCNRRKGDALPGE